MSLSAPGDPPLAGFRPKQYIECLPGKWMGPMGLYDAVRHAEAISNRVAILDAEDVELALRASVVDSDRADALQGVEIRVGSDQYRIRHHFESQHQYGDGGRAIHSTWLEMNGAPVLKSLAVVRYESYHDDSEDHEASRSEATYLLGGGELEKAVFAFLKQPLSD